MPKCPHCDMEIDSLDVEETREYSCNILLRPDTDTLEYSGENVYASRYSAACPICSQEIAVTEDAAKSFLKGEYDG